MKRLAIVLALAALLPAQAQQPAKAIAAKARNAVLAALKDPDSAVFEGLYMGNSPAKNVVCGFVNAKNSFGGYTGKKRFYYFESAAPMVVIEGDSSMEHTIPALCP